MSRLGWVLTALLCVLLIIGWYFLIFDPTSQDIEDVRAETEQVQTQTTQALARAAQLREIREEAPDAEARLAFGRSLIPEDAAIPALFRQLQQAADDAGMRLESIAPSQPTVTEIDGVQYTVIGVSMNLEGSYFQAVDLARRVEDPLLTPRALRWNSAALSPIEFPELSVSLSGQVFSRGLVEVPVPAAPPEEEVPEDETTEDGTIEDDELLEGDDQ